MPDLSFFLQFLPTEPTHPLTIFHYFMLVSALSIFGAAGEKSDTVFLILMAVLILAIAMHLYIDLINLDILLIFALKTTLFVLPLVLAGVSPNGKSRGLAIVCGVFGLCIFAAGLGLGCVMPQLVDARSVLLCQ